MEGSEVHGTIGREARAIRFGKFDLVGGAG